MKQKLELLEKNRLLLQKTLEQVKTATTLAIKVVEESHCISVILPEEKTAIANIESGEHFTRTGAQLKFTQDPNDGIEVKRIKSRVKKIGERRYSEVVENIPPQSLSKELILQTVVIFLEEVQRDWE